MGSDVNFLDKPEYSLNTLQLREVCISADKRLEFFFSRITHIVNIISLNWRLGQKVDGFELNFIASRHM